jgi:general stress protein 26
MSDKILQFLSNHEECVIATVNNNGKPEAATVGFSQNNKLQLVVGTNMKTRKFKNIKQNPSVAIVVGFEGEVTLQYEGTASLIPNDEQEARLKPHFEKLPGVEKFKDEPGQVYFLIEPTWIRYTDYSIHPEQVEEIKDFS